MEQKLINQNFVNALSVQNKALLALQEHFIATLGILDSKRFAYITDLTLMDVTLLTQLQKNLEKMKEYLQT